MKKTLSKNEIISTAFSEWGKTGFKNMSLNSIACKMHITKPALYRYFKNKEELLDLMKDSVIDDISLIVDAFALEVKELDHTDIIKLYIKKFFTYFSLNLYKFYFFIFFVVKKNYIDNPKVIEFTGKSNQIIAGALKTGGQSINIISKFIFSTGIFIIVGKIFMIKKMKTKFEESEIEKIINEIELIVFNGFGKKETDYQVDFKKIESLYFKKTEGSDRNKFFEAIASVVAKEGLWNTSIGKISKELNINKSNLYFYFKNKDQMLADMIIKEVENINAILERNASKHTTFVEKLYASMITYGSYLLANNKILHAFNWMHYQQIDFKKIRDKIFKLSYMHRLFLENKNMVDTSYFNIEQIASFINAQITKEIHLSELFNTEITEANFQEIYKYIFHGIKEKI